MAVISDFFLGADGLPKNGVTCKLWPSSAFASAPIKGTALPSSSPLQSTTTGTAHGGDGQYRFTGVTSGVYYISFEHAGTRVYDSVEIVANPVQSVKTYGAVGDGVTDDTAAITSAFADTAVGLVYFPPGTYLITSVAIPNRTGLVIEGQGATILMSGTGSSGTPQGFALSGTCRDITIRNLRFLGDGTASNYHAGIKVPNAVNVEGLRIEQCHFETLVCGVFMLRTATGVWTRLVIDACEFEDIIGTGTSQGRGVYVSTGSTEPLGLTIRDCDFEDTDLHSVHVANGRGIRITGNTFRNHRNVLASGATLPDVLVAAGSNIRIEDNLFLDGSDGAIAVAPTGATISRVRITGNQVKTPLQNVADITVGSADPDNSLGGGTGGTIEDFEISGNQFYKDGVDAPCILVNSGLEGILRGNLAHMLNVTAANTPMIRLVGSDESAGSSTYTDDLIVEGNLGVGSTAGGTINGVELGSGFCTGGPALRAHHNAFFGVAAFFRSAATITNDNLAIGYHAVGAASLGLTFDAASTPLEQTQFATFLQTWLRIAPVSKNTSVTLTNKESLVWATGGVGGITLTLPVIGTGATQTKDGQLLLVVKIDTGAGSIELLPQGVDTLAWATSSGVFQLPMQNSAVILVADDTNNVWRVLGSWGIPEVHNWKSIATGDSPYAQADRDETITADTSGGNIEIDLLAVAGRGGRRVRIYRPSASNTLTLDPNGTEQIDGAGAGTAVTLAAAAGNWWDYEVQGGEWKRVGGRY